ncbi:Rhodanese-like protein [Pyrenochaeta sp. DS3sAY3a]|nr:Rhodanese-like protein [Pyrenochaeta sp. DS3sAY3a]
MAESAQPAGSWTDAFPAPQATAPVVSREEVVSDISSPDLLLVDVRRTDYEGGTIKGSINLPAHSFYLNRAVLYDLCKRAGVKKVAFYCDYIAEKNDLQMQSLTLGGGIKGWVKDGKPYTQHMEAFDPKYWEQFK